jgi:dUTP pyrophosphatase
VNPLEIKILRLPHAPAGLPAYKTDGSAGMDLVLASEDTQLQPGERKLLPTGFQIAIPLGYEGQVRMRSGIALRTGLILPNSPGTIDSDYRGELMVLVMNVSNEPATIRSGERFAQLIIAQVARCVWNETLELPDSSRGDGGFGSTGQH